uniref:protein ALWAYS EARLY 3-like isoform X2 n=1 Tax=Erigeron canadensis TaxID=72917 RepID=UPI001CB9122D|nr:protein ALWAYS EARLY 3-like isoform X2 [Erigeron canadensis]
MAPTRKSRSVNKRYADYVDVSPSKISVKKSGQQKRKLSDMLGSPWTDEEVERFYKAYRKYGKDWKKVASVVRTRNSEMAEALYTMNRAYLSLPEGTASVVGFVAMVSDHYNAMEGSDNDKEANDFPKPVQKPKKRTHRLLQQNGGEDQKQSRLVSSSDRHLPPLKIRESDGCTVRKRTPRFPVSHLSRKEINGNPVSPYKKSQKREVDEVAHGAALALTEALQRGGSPQVSQSPYHMKTTPPKGRLKILDTARSKLHGNLIDEDGFEGSSGSGGADNVGGEVYQKGRKFYGQRDDNEFDDGGEACSGTGEGLAVGIELTDVNIEQSSSQGKRKRNKKLFFRDESSGLDALETLANLSLMIQSDSPALKEDKPPTVHRRYKTKVSADKDKGLNEFPRSDVSKSGRSKSGRESKVDYKALSEGKQLNQSTNKSWKRKNKSSSFDVLDEEEKIENKVIFASEDNAPSKSYKSTRLVEYSSSNSNTSRTGADSAISTALIPTSDGVELPSKRRNKRKVIPNRLTNHEEMKSAKVNVKDQPNKKTRPQEGAHHLKDKALRHLSSPMVRRWSTYEWFYSAIDYPWFAKREFVEYLHHVGLGHIPRLTKVEWGVIRSSLGKPRRFSRNFLREEREKLWQYRDSVRKHYTELRSGTREGLPTDLARPLAVGQRVIAIHPEFREVYDGCVLNVDHDKCRIQFDRPDIGVAFVKDIDCMPLNPLENMPEALRRENSALYRFSMNSEEKRLPQSATGLLVLQSSRDHLEQSPVIPLGNNRVGHIGSGAPVRAAESFIAQHATYAPPGSVSQMQSRETDIRALSELTRALDKKEAILTELKLVNDGLMSHKNETGIDLKVTSALVNLRQRNTYLGNPLPPSQKPQSSSSDIVSPAGPADNAPSNNQLASNVVEIVNNSRLEAHKLVHTAMQAMSKIKVEQNVRSTVATVLDSLAKRCPIEYGSSTIRSSEQANGGVFKHKLNSAVDPSLSNQASDSKLLHDSSDTDATIPFELIVSCVATYHMIQMCTERQYPPADVVQMLDSAFANLHPQCPQNLPIFREIQMCMGRVKTQILALVPS